LFVLLKPTSSLRPSLAPFIARAASGLKLLERAIRGDQYSQDRIVHLEPDSADIECERLKMASPYIARRVAETAYASNRAQLKQFVAAAPHFSEVSALRKGILQGLIKG
jgi:hypothetical protein